MNATRIEITQPKSDEFDADPDLRRALEDHRHGSFLHRAADAGNLYIARLDGAYAGGMVLGGANAGESGFDGSFFDRGFVWLIWVEEPFRRKGVASALMSQAEEDCPSDDLFTSTNLSNIPAQRLFEKLGYTRTGMVENLDEGDPEIFYFKRLRRPASDRRS
ncbi:MAG: GNAT family N-acetyltransferase [Chloroflexi bacterium]|nr:GNAT family N-acetyltransferase [Chloroflexota bacterium]